MVDHNIGAEADLIFKALAGDSVEAVCAQCGLVEQIISLDEPVDEVFLANYHCDLCDQDTSEDFKKRDLRDQK